MSHDMSFIGSTQPLGQMAKGPPQTGHNQVGGLSSLASLAAAAASASSAVACGHFRSGLQGLEGPLKASTPPPLKA